MPCLIQKHLNNALETGDGERGPRGYCMNLLFYYQTEKGCYNIPSLHEHILLLQ